VEYLQAFDAWLADCTRAGRMQRESSTEVYKHMWSAFMTWAVGCNLRLVDLTADDLERYLASRGRPDELSARYAWRLVHLVDRILGHHTRTHDLSENTAATDLLLRRWDIRYANAAKSDPLPEFLPAAEAKRLVTYLSAVRPGRGTPGQLWQEVRNRSSVALMLGAGLTPGEIRALELGDVVVEGGRTKGVPWKLRVDGNGNAPARETPVAAWAGQLLRYWLDVRAEQAIPGPNLFPSTRGTGKPWGKVAQYNAAREVLGAAGIDDVEGGSFRLRHTFALRQLRKGRAPDEIARWLGVTNPAVMLRYQRIISAPVDVV
jgi:integrase